MWSPSSTKFICWPACKYSDCRSREEATADTSTRFQWQGRRLPRRGQHAQAESCARFADLWRYDPQRVQANDREGRCVDEAIPGAPLSLSVPHSRLRS